MVFVEAYDETLMGVNKYGKRKLIFPQTKGRMWITHEKFSFAVVES